MFILLPLKAIKEGSLLDISHWLQNGNMKVNECRGGRAHHRHFVLADGTALHWAVYYGQVEIAQELLSRHAGISYSIIR